MKALACLIPVLLQAAPPADPAALLAKALASYTSNQDRQKHWNWTATETRFLTNKSGAALQKFPSVTAESVIRSDGQRCDAVVSWGDGLKPYLADADTDTRCQAMEGFRKPFEVETLLASREVKLQPQSGAGIVLVIAPDKTRMRADDFGVRCAASIQASVRLDAATFFPQLIEGAVTGSGCDQTRDPIVQYAGPRGNGPMHSTFRKSATFRMEFALQKDRFQDPANSFWTCVREHYSMPWNPSATMLSYWGRQVVVTTRVGNLLVKDIQTTAQEFGAVSVIR